MKFSVEEEITKKLSAVLWHNLDKVREIYKSSIDIEIPEVSIELRQSVLTRHDIVHRSGKDINGVEHNITIKVVKELISEVEMFAYAINKKVLDFRKIQGA